MTNFKTLMNPQKSKKTAKFRRKSRLNSTKWPRDHSLWEGVEITDCSWDPSFRRYLKTFRTRMSSHMAYLGRICSRTSTIVIGEFTGRAITSTNGCSTITCISVLVMINWLRRTTKTTKSSFLSTFWHSKMAYSQSDIRLRQSIWFSKTYPIWRNMLVKELLWDLVRNADWSRGSKKPIRWDSSIWQSNLIHSKKSKRFYRRNLMANQESQKPSLTRKWVYLKSYPLMLSLRTS